MTRLWWLPLLLLSDCALPQRVEMRPAAVGAGVAPPTYQCVTQIRGVMTCQPIAVPGTAAVGGGPEFSVTPIPVADFKIGG